MAKHKETASFHLTLFNVYRKDQAVPLPNSPPTFAYIKNSETRRILFLEPEEQGDKSMRNAFRRFYPLAEKTFTTSGMFQTVHAELQKELKEAWKVGNGPLSVRFTRAGAFLFEEEYLLVYLEVSPDMAETDNDRLVETAVNMTNSLSGGLSRSNKTELIRKFKNDQHRDSARNRFQGNEDLVLIRGILGNALTLEDMFNALAGPGWKSMLCDRFLLKSLLVTPIDHPEPRYSQTDKEELVRLARGMNRNYLPPSLEALAGHVVPVQTFANILFMAANEGIAGHIKPIPGQKFLQDQFIDRYHTGYTLLFVLAVYQHYRLIDLSRKLAEQIENPEERVRIRELRKIRRDLALHDLKYIITQPVFLTNAQQYYTGLRQGLNTGALVEKLRRSVAELDTLLADAEQREKKKRKEQHKKGEMLLAIVAEIVALPYYLYSFLVHVMHAFHLKEDGWCIWMALAFTVLVTGAVVVTTWRVMKGKKLWGFLQRIFTDRTERS
ncbi:hypothetical protein GMJAKD_08405 [Candidatus Electrothrix aarhusensis]